MNEDKGFYSGADKFFFRSILSDISLNCRKKMLKILEQYININAINNALDVGVTPDVRHKESNLFEVTSVRLRSKKNSPKHPVLCYKDLA